jgi:predicted transcriptional regulator
MALTPTPSRPRTAVAEGVAQADRGEFVPDEEMDAFFDGKTV